MWSILRHGLTSVFFPKLSCLCFISSVEVRGVTPVGTPKPSTDDDEPSLNEDDDELDDLDQEEVETNTQHLVLALFDKVIAVNGFLFTGKVNRN